MTKITRRNKEGSTFCLDTKPAYEYDFLILTLPDTEDHHLNYSAAKILYKMLDDDRVFGGLGMKKTILKLRPAKWIDGEFILTVRNDELTRRMCVKNNNIITEDEHYKWLKVRLARKGCQIFIAEVFSIPVGVARYDTDNELSWMIAPIYRRQGLGKAMVKELAKVAPSPHKVQIKRENIASIKIAEYAGLKYELL